MCSQNAGNAISENQILKISWGGHAPTCPPPSTPLANSCLRYSAHTFGDRILCWEGQGKWALWQLCLTTEESLKNALSVDKDFITAFPCVIQND
jgi:hypothetical protein